MKKYAVSSGLTVKSLALTHSITSIYHVQGRIQRGKRWVCVYADADHNLTFLIVDSEVQS